MDSIEKGSNNYIFDQYHLESFYIVTKDIVEMKLMMLDYGINFDVNTRYYNLFKKSNEEIENYFKVKVKRKPRSMEQVRVTNGRHDFEQEVCRLIELGSQWEEVPNWIQFFKALGKFIEKENLLSIFISYIDEIGPAAFVLQGVIEEQLRTIKSRENDINQENMFVPGDIIGYKDGLNWRKAEVIQIKDNMSMASEFNPYLEIRVSRKGQSDSFESVPANLWKKRIRKDTGVNKRGKTSLLRYNDQISQKLISRFGNTLVDYIKIAGENGVSIIGRGIKKSLQDVKDSIQFADKDGTYTLSDFQYLDCDQTESFENIYVIKSLSDDVSNPNKVSVFVGAKTGTDYENFRTNKNIYLTDRRITGHTDNAKLLVSSLKQNSKLTKLDQSKKFEELLDFLSKEGVEIPKGVEINVY
jgi:hypothetical protein